MRYRACPKALTLLSTQGMLQTRNGNERVVLKKVKARVEVSSMRYASRPHLHCLCLSAGAVSAAHPAALLDLQPQPLLPPRLMGPNLGHKPLTCRPPAYLQLQGARQLGQMEHLLTEHDSSSCAAPLLTCTINVPITIHCRVRSRWGRWSTC